MWFNRSTLNLGFVFLCARLKMFCIRNSSVLSWENLLVFLPEAILSFDSGRRGSLGFPLPLLVSWFSLQRALSIWGWIYGGYVTQRFQTMNDGSNRGENMLHATGCDNNSDFN